MRRIQLLLVVLIALLVIPNVTSAQAPRPVSGAPAGPPKTQVEAVKDTINGVEIIDPYRWLEDQNSPQTRAWIDAENSYTDSLLSRIPGRDALKATVGSFLKVDFMSGPLVRNGRYIFLKRAADQDQAQVYMRQGLTGKDELLIDPLVLSPDHSTTVGALAVSADGSMMIYAIRQGGEDEVTPHLYDLNTRKEFPGSFLHARYSGFAILPDKSGIYLTRQTKEGPRVYLHKTGTSAEAETEVFGKGYGPEIAINARLSTDGRYLVYTVSYGSAATKTEVYVQDLRNKGPLVTVVKDEAAAFYPAGGEAPIVGDTLYLRTNWKAPKWRVIAVDLKNPDRDHWREILPEGEGVLDGFSLVGGKLVTSEIKDVVAHIKLYDVHGKPAGEITAPTLGSLSGLSGTWENSESFFSFNSFHIPTTIYRYDIATGKRSVWFQAKVPIEADQYEVKQVWYPSKDGTRIPMFLAYAKGLKLDGSHPALLTGYGGFNVSSFPGFNASAAAWISSGGVYALANLRGGGEFGEAWHHAGMLEKKQNVFDDFIAAAEWLAANKYTSPERLGIRGSSNGGLLMGAMLTQRPDLFGAVICGYPLLDMVRYHKFLVAGYWVPEYGSADNPDQFKYIYAYSPYQHVKQGTKYPAVLFLTGDSDTRVAPLHARKMTALMQAANGSDRPILLHYDTKAGHSQGTPVSKQIENTTDELDFLLWQLKAIPAAGQTASGQK
jgi:prolyl oligopeptidase